MERVKGRIRGREKDRRERMRGVEGGEDRQMDRIVIYSQVLLHTRMEEVHCNIPGVSPGSTLTLFNTSPSL